MQCSVVQCSKVQAVPYCSAVKCSAVPYSAVPCSAVQCNARGKILEGRVSVLVQPARGPNCSLSKSTPMAAAACCVPCTSPGWALMTLSILIPNSERWREQCRCALQCSAAHCCAGVQRGPPAAARVRRSLVSTARPWGGGGGRGVEGVGRSCVIKYCVFCVLDPCPLVPNPHPHLVECSGCWRPYLPHSGQKYPSSLWIFMWLLVPSLLMDRIPH